MYLKFNTSESVYLCDCYNDKITSTLNFTIKEVEDFSELLNVFKNSAVDVYLYHDSECTLLEGQYRSYIILNLNIEYNVKTLYLSLKSSDIAAELTSLKESLNTTQSHVKSINEQINPASVDPAFLSLTEAKNYQLEIVNKECTETIYGGINVETSKGTEHFSLTEADQLNITALQAKSMSGAKSVPYHSSGQICREFTADEMMHIADKAMEYVVYCTTLCNHIRAWINRAETVEEVISIHFTSALPDDLQKSFNEVITIGSEE
ncbi:MAG: hypothetical protein K2N61_07100 [Lachnospiraceae bacterium]|nr:hypothetical protein [Lachnospiraceae bacterium]